MAMKYLSDVGLARLVANVKAGLRLTPETAAALGLSTGATVDQALGVLGKASAAAIEDLAKYQELKYFSANFSDSQKISQIDMDVSDIDFNIYYEIKIVAQLGSSARANVLLRLNNRNGSSDYLGGNYPGGGSGNSRNYLLELLGNHGIYADYYADLNVISIFTPYRYNLSTDTSGVIAQSASAQFQYNSSGYHGGGFATTYLPPGQKISTLNFIQQSVSNYFSGPVSIKIYGFRR